MYKLARRFLFLFQPETIHDFAISAIKLMEKIPLCGAITRLFYKYKHEYLKRELFGVNFSNPVGLAAGFDKNGLIYNPISDFGFGFVEIGTLTPAAQRGNPKPRCFRLTKDEAIINRMGINNLGVKHAITYIKKHRPRCVIGCSIAKNEKTPVKDAARDYELAFEYVYDFVDYVVLNVSCPNVKDAGSLQELSNLSEIIDRLLSLRLMYDEYRPILLKVSPDLTFEQLDEVIDLILVSGLDGIIATNTTKTRTGLKTNEKAVSRIGNGGLSGGPLFEKSLAFVKYISQKTKGHLPIIASGGISTPDQAKMMLDAGASLIEIYTGFIYNGPAFPKRINKYLVKCKKEKLKAMQATVTLSKQKNSHT